jgi:Mitochondrial genome maintenance MGM101.
MKLAQVEQPEPENTALAVRQTTPSNGVTPAQAKVDAIAALTMSAYAKASTLKFTDEEQKALAADFPDEAFKPGAAGKEHLIYIEHAFLRDRFNSTFGPGQWAIIPRNRWAEPFMTKGGPNKPQTEGSRVYVEAMLMIRGCFVAEAVGAMEYYPSNAGQDYSDAVEGAKTAALRRCAKELGVGLQAWKKDFGDGWWKRRNGFRPNDPSTGGRGHSPDPAAHTPSTAAARAATSPQAKPVQGVGGEKVVKTVAPKCATEEQKKKFLAEILKDLGNDIGYADEFCWKINWLIPDVESLSDLPLKYVPPSTRPYKLLLAAIKDFKDGNAAVAPYPPNPESDSPPDKKTAPRANQQPSSPPVEATEDEAWRSFVCFYGKGKDQTLGKMDKKLLYGYWIGHKVETEYNGKQKRPETIAKDQAFRAALDAAGQHYAFKRKA